MQRWLPILTLSTVVVAAACGRRYEPPPSGTTPLPTKGAAPTAPEREPPAHTWDAYGSGNLKLETTPPAEVSVSLMLDPLRLHVVATKSLPIGATVKVGETSWAPSSKDFVSNDFPLEAAKLGELPLEVLPASVLEGTIRRGELNLSVAIKLAGHKELVAKVPPLHIGHLLHKVLDGVSRAPLSFPGEPPAATGKQRTVVVVWPYYTKAWRLGPGKLLREVDWVVGSAAKDTGKTKKCGGYGQRFGSVVAGSSTLTIGLIDFETTIRDRRTGAVVATKVFPATAACPRTVYTSRGQATSNIPPVAKVIAWVQGESKRAR